METYEVIQHIDGALWLHHKDNQSMYVRVGTREDLIRFAVRQLKNTVSPKNAVMIEAFIDNVLDQLREGAAAYAELRAANPTEVVAQHCVFISFHLPDGVACSATYESPYVITDETEVDITEGVKRATHIIAELQWPMSPPPSPWQLPSGCFVLGNTKTDMFTFPVTRPNVIVFANQTHTAALPPKPTPPPTVPVGVVVPEPNMLRNAGEALIHLHTTHGPASNMSIAYNEKQDAATITLHGDVAKRFIEEYSRIYLEHYRQPTSQE